MDRREAIKNLALITGSALSYSTVAGIMGGCSTTQGGTFTPETLTKDQNDLIIVLSEQIIPTTDTPGAKEAKVNEFIDHMLTNWNTQEEKKHFLNGLDDVDEVSKQQFNQSFLNLSSEEQVSVMETLQQVAKSSQTKQGSDIQPFFLMLKEFTIVGYYTSQIGASEELALDLVPGYYDGCVPYSEFGKAWS